MRSRQYRAKKRAERAAVTRNVAGDDTRNVAAERNVTRNVAGDVIGNVPHDGALLARLLQVANGNVHPAATDTGPIAALLDQGCDLELDVLPTVRDLLGDPLQPPLRRWGAPWLTAEIVRRQDERRAGARSWPPSTLPTGVIRLETGAAAPRTSVPPTQPAPGLPSLDLGELVAGLGLSPKR
jgi:hypothetical protein